MNTEIKTAILEVLSTARIYKRRAARSWSNALAAAAMVVVTSLISGPSFAAQPEVDLVPWPKSLSVLDGRMDLTAKSRIVYADPSLEPLAEVFAQEISEATCLELPVVQDEPAAGDLFLKLSSAASFTGEAYRVEVGKHATAEAANYNAVALATVTLLQAITKRDGGYSLPRMLVLDEPEASYRGFMVDVARNYHSIKTLKEMVEMCRLYKVRYLQLHLTDDQAFTIPSKSYPQLTERSAYHYTLEELRDLVAYADQRGVTLIPEIDTPAHSTSFTRSMPD
ncbi:MAG: family 20 glycosylhydrolase, partial [Planctomycetota bacterium]